MQKTVTATKNMPAVQIFANVTACTISTNMIAFEAAVTG
jgi:hypothetical protein